MPRSQHSRFAHGRILFSASPRLVCSGEGLSPALPSPCVLQEEPCSLVDALHCSSLCLS